MATANLKAGIYGSDTDTFLVTDAGRIFLVQTDDLIDGLPRERRSMPEGVEYIDGRFHGEDIAFWSGQIADEYGADAVG